MHGHVHTQVPGMVKMKDVSIAKSEQEGEAVINKIQDFQACIPL